MKKTKSNLTNIALLTATITLSLGCASHKDSVNNQTAFPNNPYGHPPKITPEYIRSQAGNELYTTALSYQQVLNQRARREALLKRMLRADIESALLRDQVSHNTGYNIP